MRCGSSGGWSRRTHAARVKLAAHTDPALDRWFAMRNPCALCGSGLPQRHRMVNAIAGALEAGECEGDVAEQLCVPVEAVMAVMAWAGRWPGAWR
jgi:hypothetical protein